MSRFHQRLNEDLQDPQFVEAFYDMTVDIAFCYSGPYHPYARHFFVLEEGEVGRRQERLHSPQHRGPGSMYLPSLPSESRL